ncbi:hypothetical protein [Caenimonas koreensis]|uniref:hypothetical protein n=1 Tax=Caenimonas koreensis TaxID=367474 RepID=UPI0037833B94
MAIVLKRLKSVGPDREDAVLEFGEKRTLIRGPSDTGKSYIRDCLWFLLGGDKLPKKFPLAEGYQELQLRFESEGSEYEVRRALIGGQPTVYVRALDNEVELPFEPLEEDVGELLVERSGAHGKQIIRSLSERGAVTGDDVRHWALWSQTAILSENPTSGEGFPVTKRTASFSLFLTGIDDAKVELRKKTSEIERIKGQLSSAEDALARVQIGLPKDVKRVDVSDALDRVDEVLSAVSSQYDQRAAKLRELRREIGDASAKLARATNGRNHAKSMLDRFELLEQKYSNDLERLGAVNEGVAFFEELPAVPCPLCRTPAAAQTEAQEAKPETAGQYRAAITAEAGKIRGLRAGLLTALEGERRRFGLWQADSDRLGTELNALQNREAMVMQSTRIEFSADPKQLAVRRTELSAQLAIFDEMERLQVEIERLKKLKLRPKIQVHRDGGTAGRSVANAALSYLRQWGFSDIENISLDAEACDLILNDRARLSFGAGLRALYLSALVIALMEHALEEGHPHLGIVVIDSPLKAYADPELDETHDVPVATVTERFYAWLAEFSGRGQIIVLENERISAETAEKLKPIQFTKKPDVGRSGFYPHRIIVQSPSQTQADDDVGPNAADD